jgi:membrane protease YdiL (CAAX protease family)
MESFNILFNRAGRLRSGWRLLIFAGFYLVALAFMGVLFRLALEVVPHQGWGSYLEGGAGWLVQAVILFVPATLIGWGCGATLEGLPMRALGWALHRGWVRDLLMGSLFGAASLLLAGVIASAPGGFNLTMTKASMWPMVVKTLLSSALIFICSGAAEEVLFRGYPLQTVLRSWPTWAAIIPSSVAFAAIHLDNPNTVRGFTFINTTLAGVWLAVAYLRTRSLWFPLGVHWAWNWTMGAVLGLPVSGISEITPEPLLRVADKGPAWLTGGAYGIEGGAACTIVLLISTLFIWRTRLVSATEEMVRLTGRENPAPADQSLTLLRPPSAYTPSSPQPVADAPEHMHQDSQESNAPAR